jgi:hypothetical protein
MEPAAARPRPQAIDHDDRPVPRWPAARRTGPGTPGPLAQAAAGHLDWHQAAAPRRRGRPPRRAPRILR